MEATTASTYGDALLVPLRDVSGTLCSLQTITPTGEKCFLTGGKVAGGYCAIGEIISSATPVLVVRDQLTGDRVAGAANRPTAGFEAIGTEPYEHPRPTMTKLAYGLA